MNETSFESLRLIFAVLQMYSWTHTHTNTCFHSSKLGKITTKGGEYPLTKKTQLVNG